MDVPCARMVGTDTMKLYQRVKLFILDTFTNEEFHYFITILGIWLFYIWLTLQYIDEEILPLTQEQIESMASSSFDDAVSRMSPHFAKFEKNCKTNYDNYTLHHWTYITSVLSMDWSFRLIYLFIFYLLSNYLEKRYQCRIKKFISNYIITTSSQQTKIYKLSKRFILFVINMMIFFVFCVIDVSYTRMRYTDGSMNIDPGLMDYSDINPIQRLTDFVYIFIRVHPTNSWLVRLSHGIAYPFTLYAMTRPKISIFIKTHMLTIMFWIFHIGGLMHTISDNDMQLRCVRRSFIWSTRGSSVHGEAMRITFAPYLNLVCLTINCAKLVL